jgi:hypothetical protein
MLPLALFKRRNFAFANLETLLVYAALSIMFFFLILFLQQVAGYSALESGLVTLPITLIMFALSRRFGQLADRRGPRFFMSAGPLLAAGGLLLLLRIDADVDYATELLPALALFSLGLSMIVAPLTATVLADADEHNAGVASGVNTSIARVAGLLGTAALGAVVAAQFTTSLDSRLDNSRLEPQARAAVERAKRQPLGLVDLTGVPRAQRRDLSNAGEKASTSAFHLAMGIAAGLTAFGGILGAAGIRDRRRLVRAGECAGGALVGAPVDAAPRRQHVITPREAAARLRPAPRRT